MLQKILFLLPLVVAVLARNKTNNGIQYDGTSNVRISPTLDYQPQRITPATFATSPAVYPSSQWYPPGYRPFLQPHPKPGMSDSYPYSPDQFNASIPTLPGQTLKPGVNYKPYIIYVAVQPTSKTGGEADPPASVSSPSKSYPPAQLPPKVVTREPTQVVTKVPPQIVTRLPPKKVTPIPPKVVIKRPRPTGPFKTKFQCPESNGFFSVSNSCDAYFECKGYVPKRRICPNGLYFNPAAKYSNYSPCSHPSEVQCTAGNVIQRWPTNPTDQCPAQFGYFAINDGDCSRYIVCQEGLATIMNCPMGLVFNDQIQSCDWPVNVPQCTPNVFKDFTCPAPPVEKNGEISDMIYKYRYSSQCTSFVACQNGRPRLLSCDPGLAFDETSQSCISEELVANCAHPYSAAVV